MDLPRSIGRYEIRARLATGATGEVFLACAPGGPQVALKRLHAHLAGDADAVALLLDEARLAARIDHPAAVPVIDLGCEDGAWFVAFEHVAGPNVAQVLARLGERGERLPAELSVAIVVELASALSVLHRLDDAGLVHGDVSPSNVLVARDGAVRLTDLGACAALGRGAPGIFGTPGYVAPEQARGEAPGPAADVFSAGAILFELLSGAPAFPRDALPGLAAPLEGPVPELRGALAEHQPALAAAVERALAPDPRRRFATSDELLDAIRAFAAEATDARERLSALVSDLFGG
ncbi:MAG TPA: serine/threonine-protein kinase [Anaeromyxobacteraceae bacterium]|nr:serine/threonine-protein kinase [Anaeromyxobacteraceae bacterium]